MKGKIAYEFATHMWQHNSPGGWYFVSLPRNMSEEIRSHLKWQEEGWGRMKAVAQIGNNEWETAIWFDTKMKTYLLPIKAAIRKKCRLEIEEPFEMVVWL